MLSANLGGKLPGRFSWEIFATENTQNQPIRNETIGQVTCIQPKVFSNIFRADNVSCNDKTESVII